MTILTIAGGEVLVDDDALALLAGPTWRVIRRRGPAYAGCLLRTDDGAHRWVAMHRLIAGAVDGEVVDHINGDGLDNRRSNLRRCSHRENMRNRRGHGKRPFKGVEARGNRWRASIMLDGKAINLGRFDTAIEAAVAYDIGARERHGTFARLNFDPARDWLFPYEVAL